jgi:hypothetical protein
MSRFRRKAPIFRHTFAISDHLRNKAAARKLLRAVKRRSFALTLIRQSHGYQMLHCSILRKYCAAKIP